MEKHIGEFREFFVVESVLESGLRLCGLILEPGFGIGEVNCRIGIDFVSLETTGGKFLVFGSGRPSDGSTIATTLEGKSFKHKNNHTSK